MKPQRDLSLWLVTLIGCSAAVSVACSDAAGAVDEGIAGSSGAPVAAGTGGGIAGIAAGAGGSGVSMGGSSLGVAGTATTAGTSGVGTGTGGATGGGGGASAGGGSAGGRGTGGAAGAGGASPIGPFGIVSCQPAFEVACKPKVEFTNGDPTGRGKVFTDVIPDIETTEKELACTVCSMLYRTPNEIPQNKHPTTIKIVLDTHGGVAQAGGDTIQFDLDYINGYKNQSATVTKQEMLGVLQHETVHLYQNYGNGGTGEGEADLVRVRTGYYQKNRWRSEGDWKTAYTASGNFYSWLTGPCSFHAQFYAGHDLDFPYKLNKALAGKSGDAAFTAVSDLTQQLFGKSPETLWTEYQQDAYGL